MTQWVQRQAAGEKDVPKVVLEDLLNQRMSITDMATHLKLSRPTVYKLLRKHGLESAFKYATNDQIVEIMRGIAEECPQALTNPQLMQERIAQVATDKYGISISDRRLHTCLSRLLTEKGLAGSQPDAPQ